MIKQRRCLTYFRNWPWATSWTPPNTWGGLRLDDKTTPLPNILQKLIHVLVIDSIFLGITWVSCFDRTAQPGSESYLSEKNQTSLESDHCDSSLGPQYSLCSFHLSDCFDHDSKYSCMDRWTAPSQEGLNFFFYLDLRELFYIVWRFERVQWFRFEWFLVSCHFVCNCG